jgi:hypothetical protein
VRTNLEMLWKHAVSDLRLVAMYLISVSAVRGGSDVLRQHILTVR